MPFVMRMYETCRDTSQKKIFDCFFSGCIPVYWGASNVVTYIPEDCFIDCRKFAGHEKLYNFMATMIKAEYIAYQERINSFLNFQRAQTFSAEVFAQTIVKTIVHDLGIGEDGRST